MMAAEVEITRPDKLLWPAPGITKAGYVEYLDVVAVTCCRGCGAGHSP